MTDTQDTTVVCRRCFDRVELAAIRWVASWGNVCPRCATEIEDDETRPEPAA